MIELLADITPRIKIILTFLFGSGVVGVCFDYYVKKKLQQSQQSHDKEMIKLKHGYEEEIRQREVELLQKDKNLT